MGTVRKIFTPERIRWTVADVTPYQAPGVLGVYPLCLQEGITLLIGPLTNIFRPFLALRYVPEA